MSVSKGQYRYTTDAEGNLIPQRYGMNKRTGDGAWHNVPNIPDGSTMSGGIITKHNRNPQIVAKQRAKDRARSVHQRGESAKARRRIAEDISTPKAILIHAGKEINKLGAGIAEVGDFALDMVTPGGNEGSMRRTRARSEEQGELDALTQEFEEENFASGLLGKSLPYMVENIVAGPLIAKRAADIYGAVKDVATTAVKKPSGRMGRMVKKRAARRLADEPAKITNLDEIFRTTTDDVAKYAGPRVENFTTKVAGELERGVVDPINKISSRLKAQPDIDDFFRKDIVSKTGSAVGVGAIEGGLHYDDSIQTGVLSSLGGVGAGRVISPYVSKGPMKNPKSIQDTLEFWKDKGYRVDAGMDTGRPELQVLHGDKRRRDFRKEITEVDAANDQVVSKIAGRAMGLETVDNLTEDALVKHMGKLKAEYQALERGTTGVLAGSRVTQLSEEILQDLSSVPKKVAKTYTGILEDMLNIKHVTGRAPNGRFTKATFSGKDYQKIRTRIKTAMRSNQSSGGDNKFEIDAALNKILKTLDEGIENGIKIADNGATGKVKLWKDLNERYAMSKLAMDKALDANHMVDMDKLSNHLMSVDSERLLKGGGGRVKYFHKIAQLQAIKNKQAKPTLGEGDAEARDRSNAPRLLSTPAAAKTALIKKARLWLYGKGYPSRIGYLNLPNDGPYGPEQMLRAMSQGSDVGANPIDSAKGAANSIWDLGVLQALGRSGLHVGSYAGAKSQDAWAQFLKMMDEKREKEAQP